MPNGSRISALLLQLEFPSLDSSLIAAFVSERDPETLTKRKLRKLRRILAELATRADHDEQLINEAPSSPPGTHVDGSSLGSRIIDRQDETAPSPSLVTDATSPLASPRSTSSTSSFSSPLSFLRAAFPRVSLARLERVITDAGYYGGSVDDVDVERAIQLLLAEVHPRDLGENVNSFDAPIVKAKGKKRKDKLQTFAVNDIRQRSHIYAESRQGSHSTTPQMCSDVDIWTSISSISAQLAVLLPPHPESFFRSFFHSQESKTPSTAVRRALTDITDAKDGDVPPLDMAILLTLQDILRTTPEYNELSADGQEQLLSDANLCLHAVGSRVDTALDLVWLLRDLDADEVAGRKTAPYHQEPPQCQDSLLLETFENVQSPTSEAHLGPRSGRPPGRRPSQSQDDWTVVSRRKRPTGANHHGVSILPSNYSYGTAATDEIDLTRDENLARLKEQRDDLERRLGEAHMLEDKAWEGGSSKNVGRQMARYLNEEVRMCWCTMSPASPERRYKLCPQGTPITGKTLGCGTGLRKSLCQRNKVSYILVLVSKLDLMIIASQGIHYDWYDHRFTLRHQRCPGSHPRQGVSQ